MQGTIPYLGTFLTDLVMLDTAMKDFLDVCISILPFLSFLHTAAPEPGLINGGLVPHVSCVRHCTLCIVLCHPWTWAALMLPLGRDACTAVVAMRVDREGWEHGSRFFVFFCVIHVDIRLLFFFLLQGGLINFEKRRKVRALPWQQHSGVEGGG